MAIEPVLKRLHDALAPAKGARERVSANMMSKMPNTADLKLMREALQPEAGVKERVWARVAAKTTTSPAVSALDALRGHLSPAAGHREWAYAAVVRRSPAGGWNLWFVKWTAAFAAFALLVRGVPPLFLAPRSVAESQAIVLPTMGEIEYEAEGFWQPVDREMTLKRAADFRTADGEATIMLNDDGNIRLGKRSEISLHDVTNRPEPTDIPFTASLPEGQAWLQGFVPFHFEPIVVRTPHAFVNVNEGSVSIQVAGDVTVVRVWNRHATVTFRDRELILVAGEWTEIRSDNSPLVKYIADDEYDTAWVKQNMQRDAVHRRDIAQRQHERSVAQAGILPTSRILYPVKRAAEEVDLLLTFSEEGKVEKQIEKANTRLYEAAALIAEGSTGATVQLEEFRSTLREVASGSGGSYIAQSIIRQKVEDSTAMLAASRPNDDNYPIKVAILEASAELETGDVAAEEVQAVLLTDTLETVEEAVESGDKETAAVLLKDLEPRLAIVEGDELPADVRKDVESSVRQLTAFLDDEPDSGDTLNVAEAPWVELTPAQPRPVLPARVPVKAPPPVEHLSQADLAHLVQGIIARINNLELPRSRWNQLIAETKRVKAEHAGDYATVLRQLHNAFNDKPDDKELADTVRALIQELRQEQAGS
jgi:hypothetical protein